MSLAEKLVTLRKQKGLTQMDLAEQLNVSRQAVSRWEVGVAIPSTDNLKVLGDLYGVQVDYLLDDEAQTPVNNSETRVNNTADRENHRKRKPYKGIVICILVLVVSITALICVEVAQHQKQDQIVPIEDMEVEDGDDYSTVTFPFE